MKLRIILAALAIGAAPIVAGCSPGQLARIEDRAISRLQALSTSFTAKAEKLAAMVPGGLADAPMARIRANDVAIQAATDLAPVLKIYAGAAKQAVDDLLRVAEFVPGAQPYVDDLRGAMALLHAFDGGKA